MTTKREDAKSSDLDLVLYERARTIRDEVANMPLLDFYRQQGWIIFPGERPLSARRLPPPPRLRRAILLAVCQLVALTVIGCLIGWWARGG